MSSLDKLLGKKEKKTEPVWPKGGRISDDADFKPTPNALVESPDHLKPIEKPKVFSGFSLNLGAQKTNAAIPKETEQEIPIDGIMDSSDTNDNPFASLGDALKNIDISLDTNPKPEIFDGISQPDQQFQNPTLTDVEKFVFEEQPDQSTEEITDMFSGMIDDLSLATGDQVPTNVARCLKFIKEHSFLADILRPEAIGVLVTGLRRSYGFIVKAKTEKGVKKKKRNEEVSQVLDSLSGLNF